LSALLILFWKLLSQGRFYTSTIGSRKLYSLE
jgi:hypothetical protein